MKLFFVLISALFFSTFTLKGQELLPAQRSFLKEHAKPIKAAKKEGPSDWKVLDKPLENKRIVLLGELNHGAKEIFQVRNNLIRYLHEQLDFDVILFEAGIGELIHPDQARANLSAAEMTSGFFGPWRNKAFRDLMGYIQTKPIDIAGFDVQRSSGSFQHVLSEIAPMCGLDIERCFALEMQYGTIKKQLTNRKTVFESVQTSTKALIEDYQDLYNQVLQTDSLLPLRKGMFTLRTLENRMAFLSYMLQFVKDKDWNRRWATRDSIMADNVIWLSEHIYPNKKIIVIGHNFHIANHNAKEKVMGAFLRRKYADEMYAMGSFAGSGNYKGNHGDEKEMQAPDSTQLDIKHVIADLKGDTYLLPNTQTLTKGSNWLREPIVVNDSFIDLSGSNTLTLAKHFDAILLLKDISSPEK